MTDRKTCGHPTTAGTPCPVSFGLCSGCGECFHHCPCRADDRQAARKRGGNTSKRQNAQKHEKDKFRVPERDVPPPPTDATEARDYLAWLLNAGTTGTMGSQRAKDMALVCAHFVAAVKVASLEARLREMEARLAEMKGVGK
jgi:hypothetical protein